MACNPAGDEKSPWDLLSAQAKEVDQQHRAGVCVLQRAGKASAAHGFTFQVRYKNGFKLEEGRFKLDDRK